MQIENYGNYKFRGMGMKQLFRKKKPVCMMLVVLILCWPVAISYGEENLQCHYVKIGTQEPEVTLSKYISGAATNLVIPSTVQLEENWYTVTAISKEAFLNQKSIHSVQLPNTIKNIHQGAFQGCTQLKKVSLPQNLTFLGGAAFQQCISLENIEIPDTISSLGNKTFYGCEQLQIITLPQNLEKLGESVFQRCKNLTTITLPESVHIIPKYAFQGCDNLYRVEIKHITGDLAIEKTAFYNCPQLKEIVVANETVANIVKKHFAGKEIDIINLSDQKEPDEGEGPTEPENPDEGEGSTEPENPDGEDGSTEPENPDGEEGPTEPENPDGEDGSTEPENPDGEDDSTEPENPDEGEGPTEPENPDGGNDSAKPENTTPSDIGWVASTTESYFQKSVLKAQTGGHIVEDGKTVFAVPAPNYVFWQWSDGRRERIRQQCYSGDVVWAQFIPDDAVVTIKNGQKEQMWAWCAIKDQQLKFRSQVPASESPTKNYSWVQPVVEYMDVDNHMYQQALQFVTKRNLFCGTMSYRIEPDIPFTKAMAAAVLHRLMPTESPIQSNNQAFWYSADWNWALEQKLFTSVDAPNSRIDHQTFQRCLWQLVEEQERDKLAVPFPPSRQLTRGEAAVVLQDFIECTV